MKNSFDGKMFSYYEILQINKKGIGNHVANAHGSLP
jgi:hypothetical protein